MYSSCIYNTNPSTALIVVWYFCFVVFFFGGSDFEILIDYVIIFDFKLLDPIINKVDFWPSEISDYLDDVHDNHIPSPLIASPGISTCSMLYALTEHIKSYLSLRPVLK